MTNKKHVMLKSNGPHLNPEPPHYEARLVPNFWLFVQRLVHQLSTKYKPLVMPNASTDHTSATICFNICPSDKILLRLLVERLEPYYFSSSCSDDTTDNRNNIAAVAEAAVATATTAATTQQQQNSSNNTTATTTATTEQKQQKQQ
jgi:hypothetical protein